MRTTLDSGNDLCRTGNIENRNHERYSFLGVKSIFFSDMKLKQLRSELLSLLNFLAPRFSKRRLLLSILRDFRYSPRSLVGRLSAVNFANDRVFRSLRMHCNVCGTEGSMNYDFPDTIIRHEHCIGLLRETLRCRSCGATMRDRQIAYGILSLVRERFGQEAPDLASYRLKPAGTLRILDSDSFSPINRVMRGLSNYVHTQFLHNRTNGDRLQDGSVVVDLERIPFPDKAFDLVITSDVMEHVLDDVAAHHSIYRVLDSGGAYVFTVPYDSTAIGNRSLTMRTGDTGASELIFLDRHIHGDPHSDSGIVAHRIYGRQLLNDLASIGYRVTYLDLYTPAHGVFGGDLFIARKVDNK